MKMNRKMVIVSLIAACMVAPGLSFAQGTTGKAAPIVVTGNNVCLGCTLKKEQGAAAQCSIYGHTHALQVVKATIAGKTAPELTGKLLHYLQADKSADLIKNHDGELLTVTGKIYLNEQVLEVGSVEARQAVKPEHPEHPKKSEHPEHPQ